MARLTDRPHWFRELHYWPDEPIPWSERQREELIEQYAAIYPDPERQAWIRRQWEHWFQERER